MASPLEVDIVTWYAYVIFSLSEQPCYGSLFLPLQPLRVCGRQLSLTFGTGWAAPRKRPPTSSLSRRLGAWLAALYQASWLTGGSVKDEEQKK